MKNLAARHPGRSLTKADFETLALFRYLLRGFFSFSEDAAKSESLTTQQYQALLAIKGFPGRERVTIGELAERLNVRPHSAVGLADRLAGKDLIRRIQEPADRRRVLIELTGKAQRQLARLSSVHRLELVRLAPQLKSVLRQMR